MVLRHKSFCYPLTGEHSESVVAGGDDERETPALGPAAVTGDERRRGGGRGQADWSRGSGDEDCDGGNAVSSRWQLLPGSVGRSGARSSWRLGYG